MVVRRLVRFPALVVLSFAVLVLTAGRCSSAPNRPPVADAGEDQAVVVGELVTLDGSGSSDPDADSLSFTWLLETVPDGSTASLSDAATPSPSFTPDVAGGYVATLTVSDGVSEASDSVSVTATIVGAPVADAGEDQSVVVGESVTLDGSASSDPDGDSLSFSWLLETVPGGSTASLSDADTPAPSFTPDVAGGYVALLTVSDGESEASDSVSVTASAALGGAPSLSDIGDQRTPMNEPVEVAFTVSDEDPDSVTFEASSSDATLVAAGDMVVLGSGAERSLRIVPAPMGLGSVVITLSAQNPDGLGDSVSFVLDVTRPFETHFPKLTASDAAAGDRFGRSVAVGGDHAVIGAPLAHANGTDSGSAYVFRRSVDGWTQSTTLPPHSDPPVVAPTAHAVSAGDQFGTAVAIDGDYVIVGAPLDSTQALAAGAAYVYERCDSTTALCQQPWNEMGALTANDAAAGDQFGRSVAVSGDYALIGAPAPASDYTGIGSAYVFQRSGDTWNQTAKLTASDAAGDQFGRSVAIAGDYALVGAPYDGGAFSGSAYVFQRSGDAWNQAAKLTASDADIYDNFGFSVAIDGGYALVGSPNDGDDFTQFGSAYVFQRSGDAWNQVAKLTASDAAAGDEFGFSVAIDGAYALLGAPLDDDGGTNSGSAYVFKRSDDAWNQVAKLSASDAAAGDEFGRSVALNGDHALLGAPFDDDGGEDSGSVYVYLK